jgi:hypothetical protein
MASATQEGAITPEENEKHKFKSEVLSSYENQVKKGENLNIGLALFDEGLLSESDVRSPLKYNYNVDKLYWLNRTEYLSRYISYDSLIQIWNKVGLISPSLRMQIEKYKMPSWQDSRELFFSMMSLLMLHDMLSEQKNRENIIANMSPNRYRFKTGSEKIKTAFVDSKADISTLFLAVDGMYPIPEFYTTKDKNKIEKQVRDLLVSIFPNLASQFKVWISMDSVSRRLHVSTEKFQYQAEIYQEYDWDEEEENPHLEELNEFKFDADFLSGFEKILKQVGTDYQDTKIYGCRSFAQGVSNIQAEDYEWLLAKYPELVLFSLRITQRSNQYSPKLSQEVHAFYFAYFTRTLTSPCRCFRIEDFCRR